MVVDKIETLTLRGCVTDKQKNFKLEGHWASGPRWIWAPKGKDMGTGPTHTIMAPLGRALSPEHASVKSSALRRKMTVLWRYENFCITILMLFYELNINYELILSKIFKMASKHTPSLDYALIKLTSSVPGIITVGQRHVDCRLYNDGNVYIL